MNYLAILLILFACHLEAKLEDHFKKPLNKSNHHRIENIDFIYMINLEQRPEKFARSAKELGIYGIEPYRFLAVNGWELSAETVTDVGIKYEPWMTLGHMMATYYDPQNWKEAHHEYPCQKNRTYFCHCMSLGAIGICLSHLSILQDAYDSGYETIWVMEDDIQVIQNPHILSYLVKKLDRLIGVQGWDILFTDQDTKNNRGEYVPCLGHALRLNFSPSDKKRFSRRYNIGPDFRRVGARYGAYSMIIRRSGIKKLLDFFKQYNLFLPYDMDFVMPNDIHLFSVIADVVSTRPNSPSDNGGPNYLKR